ncbi:MAG: hypothetical protein WBK55_09090 [Alphaproteobacteria bacterium]
MNDEIKNPGQDPRQRNENQNIERNRKRSGPGVARDNSRGEGHRDGKR